MSTISQGLIGATPKVAFKPTLDGINAAGSYYDRFAPFALGTVATAADEGTNQRDIAQFCRIGATLTSGSTAAIVNGVSTTAATGNNWTNDTGVTLAVGDYAWLTATLVTT